MFSGRKARVAAAALAHVGITLPTTLLCPHLGARGLLSVARGVRGNATVSVEPRRAAGHQSSAGEIPMPVDSSAGDQRDFALPVQVHCRSHRRFTAADHGGVAVGSFRCGQRQAVGFPRANPPIGATRSACRDSFSINTDAVLISPTTSI